MNIVISPRPLAGTIKAIPSKSQAHRMLICAAFAHRPTELSCPQTNRDIEATAQCLRALGADVRRTREGYLVYPTPQAPKTAILPCEESGSTLRFFLPLAGALGVDATFLMAGRLPQRPLSPLWEELERMGCRLERTTEHSLRVTGKLRPGAYSIDAGVSSQFVTGLLFALSLLDGPSTLTLTGKIESEPYIRMTEKALAGFQAPPTLEGRQYTITPVPFRSPGTLEVEGDWSNGAFWMAAKHLGSRLALLGLVPDSPQGDRMADHWLPRLVEGHQTIDAAQIPDLVPILSVAAAACHGAQFTGCARLRLKETDRLETTAALINGLGGQAEIRDDALLIWGTGLTGGTVDATGDHRIAMAAAIAATVCTDPVTILGAESVEKSYPAFWDDYKQLGGIYEQYLR